LNAYLGSKIVNLSIKHGNSDISSFGYATFAAINSFTKPEFAYKIGKAALKLNEIKDNKSLKCKIHTQFGVYVSHNCAHVNEALEHCMEGHKAGIESGDLNWSGFCITQALVTKFLKGDTLESVWKHSEIARDFTMKYKSQDMLLLILATCYGVEKISSEFKIDDISEEDVFKEMRAIDFQLPVNWYYILGACIQYLHGNYAEALSMSEYAQKSIAVSLGNFQGLFHFFYFSLILTALYNEAGDEKKKNYKRIVIKNYKRIKNWARICSDNFYHLEMLLAAEISRMEGNHILAMENYDKAIISAKENGYKNIEAIANELAGKFYHNMNNRKIARVFFIDAYWCYINWGADVKAQKLLEEYPAFFTGIHSAERRISTSSTSSTSSESAELDLMTITKAARLISGVIEIHNLIKTFLSIIIENMGARRGLFIIDDDNELVVEAEVSLDDNSDRSKRISVETYPNVPKSIINYVKRSQESVVLNNAAEQGRFLFDNYIKQKKSKSILCFPIIHLNVLAGIIYLENNETPNVFTPRRLKIMELLSAQTAVSIQNARLYANLEEKVIERTKELEVAKNIAEAEREKSEELLNTIISDLEKARKIQQSLLPQKMPLGREYEIEARYIPMELVGGDLYDFIEFPNNRFGIFIADVSGHGIPAAMISSMAKLVLSIFGLNISSPGECLELMNKFLFGNISGNFLTCFYGIYDPVNKQITFSNGGHPPFLLIRKKEIIHYSAKGKLLGVFGDLKFEEKILDLKKGDRLLFYTDGIIEAQNPDGVLYGDSRLTHTARENSHLTLVEFMDSFIQSIHSFQQTDKMQDDVTLLGIDFN
jgi:serine phosphatase RsbU (regulator of sigma subunit)